MQFRIIVDSCCDLTAAHFFQGPFTRVPLTISLGGEDIVDNDTFDQTHLLLLMRENSLPPKTACPSPAQYLDAFDCGAEDLYVVTLSALLSGSHNSAAQARLMWLEDHPEAHVHIFNSCSASAGQVALAMQLRDLAAGGLPFDEVVRHAAQFTSGMETYFVLETLDNLRKNGRLTKLQSIVTSTLKIKLLMGATREGEICKKGQALSVKQALSKMADLMANDAKHVGRRLAIAHCNCLDRAFYLKDLVLERCRFGEIVISDTCGVSTVYANDGGVVASY